MNIGRLSKWFGVVSCVMPCLLSTVPANAESYAGLQANGYRTGKLVRGASGSLGWIVSKGQKRWFCRLGVSNAYVGKSGMVAFTSAGRQVRLDRETYEKYAGGSDASIPQLSDLQAGRLNARDVGACSPAK